MSPIRRALSLSKMRTAYLLATLVVVFLAGCTTRPVSTTSVETQATTLTTIITSAVYATTTTVTSLVKESYSFSDIVAKVLPSVVYITGQGKDPQTGEMFVAAGSGVIMRADGYILTNRHVVEDLADLRVTLYDHQSYPVSEESVWMDDIDDLAVVKIDGDGFPALLFGDPEKIKIGDQVIAVGNALGFSPVDGGPTVTDGIVSNLERSFWIDDTPYYDLIQTNAAINPGNSGGPLVNMNGEVIGINSVSITTAQNIGFAINIATARHIFDDLVDMHMVDHPYLGADLGDITLETMYRFGPLYDGAVITDLDQDGPAEKAGIETDDVVTSIDGQAIDSASDLIRGVWRHDPGQTIHLAILRGTDQIEKDVLLVDRPPDTNGI